jgi:NADH-quinone oxidoreductase subunit M
MMFDPLTNPKLESINDLEWRETAIFTPLIVGTVVLGLMPWLVINLTTASAAKFVALYQMVGG